MIMTNEKKPSAGGRAPSDAERPPVSRVGDELQQRADDDAMQNDDERDIAQVERDAFESAQEKGWDKSVKNS
jgi:hypothetical protein